MAHIKSNIGLLVCVILGLVSCGNSCNVEQVQLIVDGLSEVLTNEVSNKTRICQTYETLNSKSDEMRKALDACNGNTLNKMVRMVTSYEAKKKSVQQFAHFYGCEYSEEIKPVFSQVSATETEGCSVDGVKKCYAIVDTIFQKLNSRKGNPTNLERAQFCRMFQNPNKLKSCFMANSRKCKDVTGMRKYQEMEVLQLRWNERLNVGLTQCDATSSPVAPCEKDISVLEQVQACAPSVISKVYTQQKINWLAVCAMDDFDVPTLTSCIQQRTAHCASLGQDMKRLLLDQAKALCPSDTSNDTTQKDDPKVAKDYTPSSLSSSGSLGLPPLLEAVIKQALSAQALGSWKVYGGGKGMTVVLNFGDGYVPKDTCVKQCGAP